MFITDRDFDMLKIEFEIYLQVNIRSGVERKVLDYSFPRWRLKFLRESALPSGTLENDFLLLAMFFAENLSSEVLRNLNWKHAKGSKAVN